MWNGAVEPDSSSNAQWDGSQPSQFTLDTLHRAFDRHDLSGFRIAEIGVYKGATTLEVARWLNGRGEIHIYDFEDICEEVEARVRAAGFSNIRSFPNSRKTFDNYNWSLMRNICGVKGPIYDYVYLDGAHTWHVDALTFCLLDKFLLKPGGMIEFDDYHWRLSQSARLRPSVRPETALEYTEEQIAVPHITLVVKLLAERGSGYRAIKPEILYQKP